VDLSQLLKATRGTVAPVSAALPPNVGAGSTRRSLRLQIAARRPLPHSQQHIAAWQSPQPKKRAALDAPVWRGYNQT
jgi:hypothetical protein